MGIMLFEPDPGKTSYGPVQPHPTCLVSAFSTGYPICLVQVVMTAATGLPLAFSKLSHRSSAGVGVVSVPANTA